MNHHLLCALGVGHAALDQVVSITREEGLPTKLTGAGGGGCAFTVLGHAHVPLSEAVTAATARARSRLEAQGFSCFETQVGDCILIAF
jgi:mevalonate kinase